VGHYVVCFGGSLCGLLWWVIMWSALMNHFVACFDGSLCGLL